MKQKVVITITLSVLFAALILLGIRKSSDRERFSEKNIPGHEKIIEGIRQNLVDHAGEVTVCFYFEKDLENRLPQIVAEWMEDALSETTSPKEGDYIRYQLGGYETDADVAGTEAGFLHTVRIRPKYYSFYVYEQEVDEALSGLERVFGFDEETSEYERARTVYDYVCDNVSYDRVHVKNGHYFLRSTAYAALIRRTATCQGYSVLLYRMFREAGLDARIITGEARDGFHAWNIVKVDGNYYYVDATWDEGREEKEFFLKGSRDCAEHVPAREYRKKAFTANYPVSEYAYDKNDLK
mgnify:CR=1 FL=1